MGFRWDIAGGSCVGIRLPESGDVPRDILTAHLTEKEQQATHFMAPARRVSWVGGRIALRHALGIEKTFDLLSNSRGAPLVPQGMQGSVSHKKAWAVAWAGPESEQWHWGVDIEGLSKTRIDIAPRVLTGSELVHVRNLTENEHIRELMFRFSAKEALYKALDPIVHRFVSFQEVELERQPDGETRVRFFLKEAPFEYEMTWREWDNHVLTFAKVRRPVSPENA